MKHILGLALIGLLAAPQSWAQTPSGDAQTLIKLENDWKQAVINRDAAALQRLYADDYMSTDLEGSSWNKAEDIEIDTKGMFKLLSFKLDDMKVRVYGDTAVVTGRIASKGKDVGNKDVSARYRFTDVFVKRDNRWQCVSSASTPITRL